MRIVLAFLLVVLPQEFESERHRLDLEPLIQDPAGLQRLTVVYLPPSQKGWIQLFFVRGDGSLILQAHPDRPMAITDIPTCRAKVGQDVVKNLVQLIIQRHFFELPEKHFIFLYATQGNEEFPDRSITMTSDGSVGGEESVR